MSRICFASYEIYPVTSGGCGVLLHNSTNVLLSQGHEVIFLLDIPKPEFQLFDQHERKKYPHPENCRAYLVQTLCQDFTSPRREDFLSEFEWRSYRFYHASRWIEKEEHPDLIEFFDYCGIAYHALSAKLAGMDFQNTHLTIRLHTSLELIDREQPANIHDLQRYIMFGMEHQALRLAETVLYPSKRYLDQAYRPFYEPWFGKLEESRPAIVTFPQKRETSNEADGILFFGRLFGFKGIDIFVDAAVCYLDNLDNPRRKFLIAGYDSNLPPDEQGSYQDYLLTKIPVQYRRFFQFTGQVNWNKLEELLPQILFTVFPSYFESYCYAAHELYNAGIPIIASNIPAFQDAFTHGKNALIFDGTVGDLVKQMEILSTDAILRKTLSHPYQIDKDPLGDFYTRDIHASWMQSLSMSSQSTELLICILAKREENIENIMQTLSKCGMRSVRIVVVRQVDKQSSETTGWFLGQRCSFFSKAGEQLLPTQIKTGDALLILKASDLLAPDYISRCMQVLGRHEQISYVGSWKQIRDGEIEHLDTFPFDVASELTLFNISSLHSRYILRTTPGKLLIDLFDSRANQLGELAYIWSLETDLSSGVTIPEPLITIIKDQEQIQKKTLSYLIIREENPWRKARLSRLLLVLQQQNRNTILDSNEIEYPDHINFELSPSEKYSIKIIRKIRSILFFRKIYRLTGVKSFVDNMMKMRSG